MKLTRFLLASLGTAVLATGLFAQQAPGLKKIGISDVKPTPAIVESVKKAGRANSLDRVVQALDSQLIDRVQSTRKFEVIARSDLASILKDADVTGGAFKVNGVDYLLVTSIDDFQDFEETATFAALGKTATRRVVRFSAVGKIYESETGKLIESTNFQISTRDSNENIDSAKNGELSDALLLDITRGMADKIANRVADVIFPAKIISRIDKQVTLNRGDGTGIAIGQLWQVFALGEELVDPDTGVSLGREELPVGKIRVTRVNPKTATADIVEDASIDKGAIVRPPQL